MPLREELERSGVWLFRWRSYLPLVLLGFILSQLPRFSYLGDRHDVELAWQAACLVIGLAGLAVRVHVAGHAPEGTSSRDTDSPKAPRLNTTGWYSIVRHPLYVGNLLMWLAVALFLHLWLVVLITVLTFALYYERIMLAEEEWLRGRFGDEFVRWADRTPAFLPDPRLWRSPPLRFSLRTALRREYSGFFGLIATLTVLAVAGDWIVTGRFRIDPFWAIVFAVGAVSYCLLLYLKRHTGLLHVGGR